MVLLAACGSQPWGLADDGCDEVNSKEKGLEEETIFGFAASDVLPGIPLSTTSTEAVYGNGESATIHIDIELGSSVFERSYKANDDVACPDTVGVGASTHFYTEDGIWDQWLSAELRLVDASVAEITAVLAPEEVTGGVVERFERGPDTGRLIGVLFLIHFVDRNGDGVFGSFGAGNAIQEMGPGRIRHGSDGYAHVRWGGIGE